MYVCARHTYRQRLIKKEVSRTWKLLNVKQTVRYDWCREYKWESSEIKDASKLILNWVCTFAAIVIACSGESDNDVVFSGILFVLGVEGLARQWRGKYKLRLSLIYRRSRYITVFRSIPCPIVRKLIDISIYLVSYTYVSCLKLSVIYLLRIVVPLLGWAVQD